MKKYIFRPYDNTYPHLFNNEVDRLKNKLPKDTLYEHIGSTSVPGLGGKGFIDILIGTEMDNIISNKNLLIDIGYEFEAEASTNDRYYFDRKFIDPYGTQSMYHLHLTYPNGKDWIALIAFRNYLRRNKNAMKEYAEIKKHAARIADQKRSIYVNTKNPVLFKLLDQAMKTLL